MRAAEAMQAACDNPHIGYDQGQRITLLNAAAKVFPIYSPGAVTVDCETDCSALVRVCIAYAVGKDVTGNFNTSNQATALMQTGLFEELVDSKYRTKEDYLRAGDIQVTKTKGHTIIVLTNGSKAEPVNVPVSEPVNAFGSRNLKRGNKGEDVRELQRRLIEMGISCGSSGADGDFGSNTEKAVKEFQKKCNIAVTGIVDQNTFIKLNANKAPVVEKIQVTGTTVNIRAGANTSAMILKVAKNGEVFDYLGNETADWWNISYNGGPAWISKKYSVKR